MISSPLDALSESYIPDVLLVLLRGVSADRKHDPAVSFSLFMGLFLTEMWAEVKLHGVLLSPLDMLGVVSVLPLLPLDRPSLLGVLDTLRPAGPVGVVLSGGRPRFAPVGFTTSFSSSFSDSSLFCRRDRFCFSVEQQLKFSLHLSVS